MRNRVRKVVGDAWNAVARGLWAVVTTVVSDRDEVVALLGLVLVTVALWPTFARGALLIPGLVCLWVALPQRAAFLKSQPVPPTVRRARED